MLTFFLLTIFNSFNERTTVCKDFLTIHFLIHVYMKPSVMCQIKTNNQMPTLFYVYLYFSPIFQISFVSRQAADQTICSTKQPPQTATLLAWLASAKPLASAVSCPPTSSGSASCWNQFGVYGHCSGCRFCPSPQHDSGQALCHYHGQRQAG